MSRRTSPMLSCFSLQPNFDKSTPERIICLTFFHIVYRMKKRFWIAESPCQRTGTTVSCGSLTSCCTITAISQPRCGERCLRIPRITITIWRRVWRVALALSFAGCSLWKIWPWLAFRTALYSSSTLSGLTLIPAKSTLPHWTLWKGESWGNLALR